MGKIGQDSRPIYLLESNTSNKDWINSQGRAPLGCSKQWKVEEQEKKSLYKIQGTQEIGHQSREVPVITRNYRQHMAVRSKRRGGMTREEHVQATKSLERSPKQPQLLVSTKGKIKDVIRLSGFKRKLLVNAVDYLFQMGIFRGFNC